MSSFLFYSSPPRSSHHSHFQTSPTSFFTPQVHGSRILGWPQSFSPPVALHASRNADNIMRSPVKTPVPKRVRFKDAENKDDTDEVMQEGYHHDSPITTRTTTILMPEVDGTATQSHSHSIEASSLHTVLDPACTNPLSPFLPPHEQQQHQQPRSRFQFQQRSHNFSSPALLSSTIANARSARQSGSRFLERLRSTRHERRDRRGAEAVEQIDFFHERRRRAAYFEQEARQRDEDLDLDLEENQEQEWRAADGEMSPTEEDKEVEDLVRRYYGYGNEDNEYEHQSGNGIGGAGGGVVTMETESDTGTNASANTSIGRERNGAQDDEDEHDLWREDRDEELEYDRLFMELLSQGQGSAGGGGRMMNLGLDESDRDMEMS